MKEKCEKSRNSTKKYTGGRQRNILEDCSDSTLFKVTQTTFCMEPSQITNERCVVLKLVPLILEIIFMV